MLPEKKDAKPSEEGIIILYSRTIKITAEELSSLNLFPQGEEGVDALRLIVLLHEIGHWISHCLPDENGVMWENGYWNDLDKIQTIYFHEAWAQLMVFWVIEDNIDLLAQFTALADRQKKRYRKYEDLIGADKETIIQAFIKLRSMFSNAENLYQAFNFIKKYYNFFIDDNIKIKALNWLSCDKNEQLFLDEFNDRIKDDSRELKLPLEEFLHKHRGSIKMKKFGL